jgi:hypothetical protein
MKDARMSMPRDASHLPFVQLSDAHSVLVVQAPPVGTVAVHFRDCVLQYADLATQSFCDVQSAPTGFRAAHFFAVRSQYAAGTHAFESDEVHGPPTSWILVQTRFCEEEMPPSVLGASSHARLSSVKQMFTRGGGAPGGMFELVELPSFVPMHASPSLPRIWIWHCLMVALPPPVPDVNAVAQRTSPSVDVAQSESSLHVAPGAPPAVRWKTVLQVLVTAAGGPSSQNDGAERRPLRQVWAVAAL